MLTYPHIDPVALQIGPVRIFWYGIMYLIGFTSAWLLGCYRARKWADWTVDQVTDLMFYLVLGVVLGGRLGYFVFYNFSELLSNPLQLFRIWQGGMAFHGGLIGVVIGVTYFARKNNKTFGEVADFACPLVPIGLGLGRLGNFINGELWGRVTDVPWAMVFPHVDALPRHPSQIYEFLLEGVVLFTILWAYSAKRPPAWSVSGLFLVLYGLFRFAIELVRQPDVEWGILAFGWLTMGQLLSLPMVIAGILFIRHAYRAQAGHAKMS